MQYYGILGTGDAPRRVIEGALNDYTAPHSKTMALVPWYGLPGDGLEAAYGWLEDNEMSFVLVVKEGKKPPRALARAAQHVIEDDPDPAAYIVRELEINHGELLLLFDTEHEERSQDLAFMALDRKVPVKELNNGLVPVMVETEDDEEEEEEERPRKKPEPAEDKAKPLSEEEIRAMTAADMRKVVKAMGIDTKGMVKADLLDILLKGDQPLVETDDVAEDAAPAVPVAPPMERSEDPAIRATTDAVLGHLQEDLATVVIVLSDGTTVVKHGVHRKHLSWLMP